MRTTKRANVFRPAAIAVATTAALALPLAAQATNGYQLIGVGAYQKGMGGATVAAPGSAMTAVTNPAGMARVGKRADFSMESFNPDREVDFSGSGGDAETSEAGTYGVPAIGWTAPTSDDSEEFWFGGGMYGSSGMGVDYGQTLMMPDAANPQGGDLYWDGYSNIQLWEMAPTLAWQFDEQLTLGASLNIGYQSVAFQQRVVDVTNDQIVENFNLSRASSSFGTGFSLGVLYDLNDELTLGASYKSKQSFSDLEYQLIEGDITQGGDEFDAGTYSLGLDLPRQLALGAAYQAMDDLLVSVQVKWINWSDTMDELTVEGPGNDNDMDMDPGWDDQTVFALGANWQATPDLQLRAGFNYAEAPFGDDEVANNLILPAVMETHYTLGGTYDLNNRWELGFHYMHAPEVSYQAPNDDQDPNDNGQEIALSAESFGVNIGYKF